ncbi:hypothetical protein HPB48_015145 [Haemaphysalis longicornis]|uniref:AAA+ ATPase domain-containing protein n=1 Tax=Haemaphysalis longicornis TaxID=44386 RepID=A0A9J6FLK3_HAELO|nr:hypothetical protein HPB48_015145 [Haemaphysalis longicornis]
MAGVPALDDEALWIDGAALVDEASKMSTDEMVRKMKLPDNEIKVMHSEITHVTREFASLKQQIKENDNRIKAKKALPHMVASMLELLDADPQELGQEDGATMDSRRKNAVVKTTRRQDSCVIMEKLPHEYDSRVTAMQVDEWPTEEYSDIGGLDKQIQELVEAVVLPITHNEKFANIGRNPPKGVLLYRPPGTGKTLLGRDCAAQAKSTFLKLAGPQLVQTFIGEGARLVRDAFKLAQEKAPAIIFIDEVDAIGTKRFSSQKVGDREVQRTLLELLNQLDGFSSSADVRVIAATNRVDMLDPALLRSGRLDRKIEFPHPDQEARARIMQIHSRKMNYDKDVNFEELARCTDGFNGAQCKAVCVEAGMIAMRRNGDKVTREDTQDIVLSP